MKILFAGFVAILMAFPVVAQQNAAGFEAFTDQLERMCNKEFVTLEQSRACKTGGMLVFGAPAADSMDAYLVLLDQCTATYQDAGSQFAPAIPFSELRAACQTGLIWARISSSGKVK